MRADDIVEELLEFIWTQRERGIDSVRDLLRIDEVVEAGGGEEALKEMEREGLVKISGDSVELTPKGAIEAEEIVRRHRLAERLLFDVLDMEKETLEEHACSFEHSISREVADSICALLGHPPSCPHGLPIPRGKCCEETVSTIRPLVMPFTELDIGQKARVVFIVPKTYARLEKLGSMGLVPGSIVRLQQKKPAFVLELGQTTLALDPEIVKDIFVKKAD